MQYLFTERAHLMCPHMCFGLVMTVSRPYDAALIRQCVDRLAAAHPFLNALLGYEEAGNVYFYRVTDQCQAELLLKEQAIPSTDAPEIMEAYQQLTGRDWNLLEEGLLKIAAWSMGSDTCFLLVFHHLLTDGRGALGLAEELADCYAIGREPTYTPEQLIASANDLPADSRLPFISRILIQRANKAWEREQRIVSYGEYHAFAESFLKQDQVSHPLFRTSREELEEIHRSCHERQVTVNDYLMARMMLEAHTGKVVMACDLRDRLGVYRKGALGNYSTAFSIEAKAGKADLYALAKAVRAQVQKKLSRPADLWLVLQCYANLDPGLIDAALISCRGDFPSKAGRFIGSKFFGFSAADGFSVTNLGRIESESISSAFFIPPASPAIRKTWGVLTVNGVMTVCASERASGGRTSA